MWRTRGAWISARSTGSGQVYKTILRQTTYLWCDNLVVANATGVKDTDNSEFWTISGQTEHATVGHTHVSRLRKLLHRLQYQVLHVKEEERDTKIKTKP